MTLTKSKSVRGATKPATAKKPASKPAATTKAAPKAKAAQPAKAPATPANPFPARKPLAETDFGKFRQPIAKPAEPKGGRYVVIAGEGTMPIGDGDRRVKRGESDWASDAEIAWLKSNGCEFKLA